MLSPLVAGDEVLELDFVAADEFEVVVPVALLVGVGGEAGSADRVRDLPGVVVLQPGQYGFLAFGPEFGLGVSALGLPELEELDGYVVVGVGPAAAVEF